MKNLTTMGWYYMLFGLVSCGYFCAAAVGGWQGPNFDSGGNSFSSGSSYGHTTGGWSYGRTSGGSWGGGK